MARCGLEIVSGEYPDNMVLVSFNVSDSITIPWCTARYNMYGGGGFPRVRFDGLQEQAGAPSCAAAADNYRGQMEQRLTSTNSLSPINLEGTLEIDGNNAIVSATATLLDPVALVDLRITVLILEDGVVVSSNTFDHITRDAFDQDIALVNPNDFAVADHVFINPGGWNMENISGVVFVQRMSGDYEIYQTARLMEGSSSVDELPQFMADGLQINQVYPNPLRGASDTQLRINFALPNGEAVSDASLELVDLNGRIVRRLHSGSIGSPEVAISWDGRDDAGVPLQSGAYWLRVNSSAGNDHRRLLLLR
jgi:FlgD Ig-like domain